MIRNFAIIFVFFPLFSFSSEAKTQESILDKVQNKINTTSGFTAIFEQINYDSLTDKKRKASGKVKFLNPGLMKWEYNPPEEQLIIVGKEEAWIYDPVMENVTIQELRKVSGLDTISFLRGTTRLEEKFELIKQSKEGAFSLITLKPIENNKDVTELVLKVSDNFRIESIKIEDAQKNYRYIEFSEFRYKPLPQEEEFTFKITDDIEVLR